VSVPSSLKGAPSERRLLRKRRPLTLETLCQPSGPDGEGQARGQARWARGEPLWPELPNSNLQLWTR